MSAATARGLAGHLFAPRTRPPATEAELVRRARTGKDPDAFAELVRRHEGRVRSLLLRLCGGDRALVDDLAQDVFLRAYRGLPGFAGRSAFGTWLYRIAYNIFLNHATRTRAHDALEPGATEAAEPLWDPGEDTPDRSDLRRDLDRAIATLPPAYRAAVVLYYLRGVSYADMAQILDLPLGTVKTHLHRARAALRGATCGWAPAPAEATTAAREGRP